MQSSLRKKLHIAIIMDGNGRWAEKRNLPRLNGHCAGVSSIRHIVNSCPALNISMLTLYAFSSDNWKRPAAEVTHILDLLRHYLNSEVQNFIDNDIRCVVIGRRDRLPKDIVSNNQRSRKTNKTRNKPCPADRIGLFRPLCDYSSGKLTY